MVEGRGGGYIVSSYQSVHYVLVSALSQYLAGVFNKHCLLTFLVLFCLFVVFLFFKEKVLTFCEM